MNADRNSVCGPRALPLAVTLAVTLAVALSLSIVGSAAWAAEFSVPPGQNPEAQEQLLKNRMTTIARDMVGEHLIDVVAHVGYVRTETRADRGPNDRIRLPGFNSFINQSGQGNKVTPEYTRVRQVFVIVAKDPSIDREPLEEDLRRRGKFKREEGDWLEVVFVMPQEKPEDLEEDEAGRPAAGAPPPTAQQERAREEESDSLLPRNPLKEPRSTAFLLRARTHFFAGEYHKALDQILQAIRIKPDNPQAYTMLGSIYFTMNWRSLALKYWEIALSLDPGNTEISELITQIRATE